MTDRYPTFRAWRRALAAAWERFSYSESVAARGAVWTAAAWLAGGAAALAFGHIRLSLGGDTGRQAADAGMHSLFVVFPGTPLIGFILGAALAGRAAGFWNALWRALKAASFLTFSLLLLAALTMGSENEKAGLLAAILFWIAVSGVAAALAGGALRRLVDLGQARTEPAAAPAAAAPAGPAGEWLEAVAASLRGAGLLDYASAMAFHKQLRNSGQADPEGRPPFEDKYEEVFLKLKDAFPAKDRTDWLAANEYLRRAVLTAARAGGGSPVRARAALEAAFPGRSGEFYDWAADCARKLP